jgi:hypothetical protein
MADWLADAVYDAALAVVSACDKVEVRKTSSGILVSAEVLTAGNFTLADRSPDGRQLTCLVSDSSDMKAIAVDATGQATKVVLIDSVTDTCMADLSSPVSLLSTDEVNLGTFVVAFPDAT